MANADPPQAVPQLGPQPDFLLLKQGLQQTTTGLQQASTELEKLANLPPLAQGNAIMQQMKEMQEQMKEMQEQMKEMQQQTNQNFAAVRADIRTLRDDMNTNYRAMEHNSIARLENSSARRSDHPLTALHDYTTNADISRFPATPAELANMTPARLDPVLKSLGLPVNGTVVAKRQRLRLHIGLVDLPH